MKVTQYDTSNGLERFMIDDKILYVYDSGGTFSVSWALRNILLKAYKEQKEITLDTIQAYI